MSSKYDPTAEGSVAPENLPSKKNSSTGKQNGTTPTLPQEGSVAPENTKPAIEEKATTSSTGPVVIGCFTFPSKQVTGTAYERQKQTNAYKKECEEIVKSFNWIAPTELTGDLLEGYFNGTLTQEECEQLALAYMEEYGIYNDPDSHTEKRYAVRASVISCQYSDRLTHLDIFEDHGVQDQGGNAVLTCADCRVGENIVSFGICKSTNSVVRNSPNITIKDGNKTVTGHMCMLKVATDWITSDEVHVHIWNAKTKRYEKCLPANASLICTYGAGKIRIVEVPLITNHEIRFINDRTGEVFNTQSVEAGEHAVPPTPPAVSGCKFYKWDSRKYRNVNGTADICAIYNPVSYKDTKNMLTDEELEAYMAMLSADLHETRRAVIQYALESVGTIPYYYGGKSETPGYTQSHKDNPANDFCEPGMTADQSGRTYRGLDCSGWVYWVRWTVTGDGTHHDHGTYTLAGEGAATDIDNLKPGDIIGTSGVHVIMFLAYQGDDVLYIDESGSIGNVKVQEEKKEKLDKKYKFKRSLDEWYEKED